MWWGPGWGWAGAVFVVICMVVMARMMGHSGHGGHGGHGAMEHDGADAAERTLANRLASGEIDIDQYERLHDAIRRTDSTAAP